MPEMDEDLNLLLYFSYSLTVFGITSSGSLSVSDLEKLVTISPLHFCIHIEVSTDVIFWIHPSCSGVHIVSYKISKCYGYMLRHQNIFYQLEKLEAARSAYL